MAGDCFEIRIKTCISHQGPGKARLNVSCIVHFLKGTWIRLAIEKAGPDALREYYSQLKDALEDKIKLEPPTESLVMTKPLNEKRRVVTEKASRPLSTSLSPSRFPMPHPSRPFSSHPLEKELESLQMGKNQKFESQRDVPSGSANTSTTFVTNQKRPSSHLHRGSGLFLNNGRNVVDGISFQVKDLWNSHKDSVVPILALFISVLTAINFYVLFELQSALGELRAIKAARDPPVP